MTLVNAETGEVVERRSPRMPKPMTSVQVAEQCRTIEAWASRCDSVDEIREADNRLAAIAEYVKRTSTEGRARVEAARRRLEARIGTLIGPAAPNGGNSRNGSLANDPLSDDDLTANERSQFRKLADHPEVLDAVIDESDDANPASRRRVLDEINRTKQAPPPPETDAEREARELAEADQRTANRLINVARGWTALTELADNSRRDHILALIDPAYRRVIEQAEEAIHE